MNITNVSIKKKIIYNPDSKESLNDDRAKDFAFVMDFLEEYFTQNLNNKLG